jgi:tryptophan synthase alpha chain
MKKLIAYITCAYPDKSFTIDLINSLKENGVDGIELGIPFSDPVADGPVIQEANKRALENGFKLNDLFEVSEKIGKNINTYWMGYFNNFYHKGYDFMVKKAKEAGMLKTEQ